MHAEYTGCFTMNDTKAFAYFSAYDASLDLKHVEKISLELGHSVVYRLTNSVKVYILDFCWPLKK